jgi:hypothetical protein
MTEDLLFDALKRQFVRKRYAVLRHVANTTGWADCREGFTRNRYIDAIAMCCWPSKGLEIDAFELKTSRSDYLREVNDMTKSSDFTRYVNRFWLVTPEGLVSKEEIPVDWGLWELSKDSNRLNKIKSAPSLTPEPLDRGFVASILRGLSRQDPFNVEA